jgi:transcription elongation factor Elf1
MGRQKSAGATISVGAFLTTGRTTFNCSNCNALYQIVKVKADPETVGRAITCRPCGAPLPAREGSFVVPWLDYRNDTGIPCRCAVFDEK